MTDPENRKYLGVNTFLQNKTLAICFCFFVFVKIQLKTKSDDGDDDDDDDRPGTASGHALLVVGLGGGRHVTSYSPVGRRQRGLLQHPLKNGGCRQRPVGRRQRRLLGFFQNWFFFKMDFSKWDFSKMHFVKIWIFSN